VDRRRDIQEFLTSRRARLDVFDFELSAEELAAIDALDTGKRGGPSPRPSP
jgi:diketogulonate reductase-like aldo/keto reductase